MKCLHSDKKNLQIIAIKFIADCVQKSILHPYFEIDIELIKKYDQSFNSSNDTDKDTNQPILFCNYILSLI